MKLRYFDNENNPKIRIAAPIIDTLGTTDRCQLHLPGFRMGLRVTGVGFAFVIHSLSARIVMPVPSVPRYRMAACFRSSSVTAISSALICRSNLCLTIVSMPGDLPHSVIPSARSFKRNRVAILAMVTGVREPKCGKCRDNPFVETRLIDRGLSASARQSWTQPVAAVGNQHRRHQCCSHVWNNAPDRSLQRLAIECRPA